MKHTAELLILFILILTMAGCGKNESSHTVDKIINEQTENAKAGSGNTVSEEPSTDAALNPETDSGDNNVDYDLTAMSSDMVYAVVYQMMGDPDTYIGKTVRMEGLYYGSYYEPAGQYYHFCIIQDALACCAQGLEFVWDDGNHIYPDEYPEENTEVIVQGIFETYNDDGVDYCRLNNAKLESPGVDSGR